MCVPRSLCSPLRDRLPLPLYNTHAQTRQTLPDGAAAGSDDDSPRRRVAFAVVGALGNVPRSAAPRGGAEPLDDDDDNAAAPIVTRASTRTRVPPPPRAAAAISRCAAGRASAPRNRRRVDAIVESASFVLRSPPFFFCLASVSA